VKTCQACHRLYPDDGGFCPTDGQQLVPTSSVAPPSDPEDKRVGSTYCNGRYQIWRRVADGGMGRVYQALDIPNGRSVAMKILHSDVATDGVAVERFKREFECSAALPHDYIVEVFAFERTEDQSFALVMEYLEGEELRTLLKREKVMRPERVIRMVAQLALGLAAAHERQVVHRDLKPDNIFMCHQASGDRLKILDFGSVRDNSANAKKLTVMGTTIGSPFYMAPEQAQGLPSLDHRADVWSCAAIAYECLTGVLPFQGTTGPAILLAILTSDPKAPSDAGKDQGVPRTLDHFMEEALAKEPSIRIPTMAALADRLGKAYGLTGDLHTWAVSSDSTLRAEIDANLPAAIAKLDEAAPIASLGAMDAAFADPFKAGSVGGPAQPSSFGEDLVMGVPKGPPKWIIPAIVVVFLIVGASVAFLAMR
jgi:serine/threonine-protein kinase